MRILARTLLTTVSALTLAAIQANAAPTIKLTPLGSYREPFVDHSTVPPTAVSGVCRRNISEIGAYDQLTRRLFVNNYADNSVDIYDMRHPEKNLDPPRRITVASLTGDANLTPNSVAVHFPLVAVAVESIEPLTGPGGLPDFGD